MSLPRSATLRVFYLAIAPLVMKILRWRRSRQSQLGIGRVLAASVAGKESRCSRSRCAPSRHFRCAGINLDAMGKGCGAACESRFHGESESEFPWWTTEPEISVVAGAEPVREDVIAELRSSSLLERKRARLHRRAFNRKKCPARIADPNR
jgi:hypothetical protein